jgi:hypothetical protein
MPFVLASVCEDHRDLDSVDQPDRVDSDFTVVEAVIHTFNGRSRKNPLGVFEGDGVPANVLSVLFWIPREVPCMYVW